MSKYLTKFPVLFTKVTKYFLLNYLKPTFNLTTLQAILGLEIKSISITSWKKEHYFFLSFNANLCMQVEKNGSQYHVSKLT